MVSHLILGLVALSVLLFVLLLILLYQNLSLRRSLLSLGFSKRSLSTRYGLLTEQFIPFARNMPFSPSNFRFIGNPIDGIAFEDDKIIFCEFKTNKSRLSEKQRRIRALVEGKRVFWFEKKLE